jgi:hypothetical protein
MVHVEERIDAAIHDYQLLGGQGISRDGAWSVVNYVGPSSVLALLAEAAEEIKHLRKQLASK